VPGTVFSHLPETCGLIMLLLVGIVVLDSIKEFSMKKVIVAVAFAVFVAAGAFGQETLNIRDYSNLYLDKRGGIDYKYLDVATDNDYDRISALGGNLTDIDTPLEIALLSSCAGVVDVRPVQANEMLGTPKQADLKFGFWVTRLLLDDMRAS
jgi:hypothetical protein